MLPEPTSRLRFREMNDSDLIDLTTTLAADPHTPSGRPRTRADAERWIEWTRTNYAEHGFGLWVVETHEGRFVGDCGLTMQDVEGDAFVEVGWHVHPDLRRRGYATEAATAVRDAARATAVTDHLIAIIRPQNIASQGVARGIGLTLERRVQKLGDDALIFGVDLQD